MKNQTLQMIYRHKITAIIRGVSLKDMLSTAQALYDGGIRLLEITYDQSSPTCLKDTPQAISEVVGELGGVMCIGAGTVMTEDQVAAAQEAGARFVLSPNTNQAVIEKACLLDLVSIPGALTPTEITGAYEMGADIVKLFPAGDLGLGYIKSIKAPLNHIPMMAVGGVDENNIRNFFEAGLCSVGIGSNIVKRSLIEAGNFGGLTALAKLYTDALQ